MGVVWERGGSRGAVVAGQGERKVEVVVATMLMEERELWTWRKTKVLSHNFSFFSLFCM